MVKAYFFKMNGPEEDLIATRDVEAVPMLGSSVYLEETGAMAFIVVHVAHSFGEKSESVSLHLMRPEEVRVMSEGTNREDLPL